MTRSRSQLGLALFLAGALLAACGGGGGGGGSTSVPVVTPTPTLQATANAFSCPSSDSSTTAGSISGGAEQIVRRAPRSFSGNVTSTAERLAVSYDRGTALRSATSIAAREQSLGASLVRELDFDHIGVVTRILSVAPSQAVAIAAALRAQSGVIGVAPTGERRYPTTVTTPFFPNDPYFNGFLVTVAPTPGATLPPPTYHVGPYEENAAVPGQWDMHAIKLEYAFGYSQPLNGSGITNAAALGSSSIKVAVIDTGQDTTHPELASKVVYQKCFITNNSGVQSTTNFTTDPDGHGTDVTGIAGAATNNSFGFTAAGGNVVLYGYRVYPTPNDSCANPKTNDNQCGTNTADVASALQDAVAQHVNVISLSLGGGGCTAGGQDSDPVEGQAIANAIAANVIVVAASGNGGTSSVTAPACDPGVIAVGATSLADGQTNGAGNANGSASAPLEYVASYSQYGSPPANLRSASAWGIVAPGGDPSSNMDNDDLHWTEHIWTSKPFDSKFAGSCGDDYPNGTLTNAPDCRVLIAGTSMATPHVAGVAALLLSVNSSYQSPARMKQLLCSTADDIADGRQGCGRLNAYRAMATALGDPNLP